MNKIYKLFALSMVALVGLSLTGCSDDNLDTNPYNKSGVNLVAFGPSPILRTHEIRITGTNLNSVTQVVFPGEGATVDKAAFNKVDDQDIYVNVPDASVPGQIKLMVGSEAVATSITPITFEEPIEITSVSPTTGLSAGDEVTVKGDYVYNIYQAIFTSGVTGAPVNAENFTYVSRREIRFIVPLDAESGVITFTDGADWELEYETPLEILSATYTGISTTTPDFGEQIQISGTNLHTVESVMFPGGVISNFTVSEDHKTLTTTVPAETKSGKITLVLYSGASLTTDECKVPTIAITEVSKTKDLKVGDVIVLTGENFDRIQTISLPGYGILADDEYVVSGNTLTFTVPEEMTDGKMEIVQNSFISITQAFMMYSEAAEVTIWANGFECSGWNGCQDLAWGGFDWSTVAANSKVNFYYKKNNPGAWGCISLRHGNSWGNLPSPIPGQYDLDSDEGVLSVVFTQEVLNDIIAEGGLVITGDNYTLSKITIPASETILWKGELGPTNWSGDKKIELTDEMKAELTAGRKMGIEFHCDEGGGQVEICGSWWTGLEGPKLVYGTNDEGRAIMNFSADVTNFEWTLVQGDIDILLQQGAILFVGNGGLTITKWYVK